MRAGELEESPDRSAREPAGRLEILLLGGFEIRVAGQVLGGFESNTARALVAYLACNSGRPMARDVVASLLWPEVDERTALHNLRQALYSLRQTFQAAGLVEGGPLRTSHRAVAFELGAQTWVDVQAFAEASRRGLLEGGGGDPNQLAKAAQLYRGDFLAGFYLRDSPSFEEWLSEERARLQEEAMTSLRRLVRLHLEAGRYPLSMQYIRQLLRIDPYSEEEHRDLMQVYALSGRRSRALAHYQELSRQLERELGVEPAEETRALAQRIENEEIVPAQPSPELSPSAPRIPFVEREAELARLEESWAAVLRGSCRLTLVEGPAGMGKTRLIRSFLDVATSRTRATVLLSSGIELSPPSGYRPFSEALANAIATDTDLANRILLSTGQRSLQELVPLIPELAQLEPKLAARPRQEQGAPTLLEATARLIEVLADRGGPGRPAHPVILFLDDLHTADQATIELLGGLLSQIPERPCWLLGSFRPDGLEPDHPLSTLLALHSPRRIQRIALEPLTPQGTLEIARSLVAREDAEALGEWLFRHSSGVPLLAAELANGLADLGVLLPTSSGRWLLSGELDQIDPTFLTSLEELLRLRLRGLPPSARRLLTLAAVLGQTFDADLLREAEGEHVQVVEIALRLLMERWFLRPYPRYWGDTRQARVLASGAAGTCTGIFEFTHPTLRALVYRTMPAERLAQLHRRVAEILELRTSLETLGSSETIAYHFGLAGAGERAKPHAQAAALRAELLRCEEVASYYRDLAEHRGPIRP